MTITFRPALRENVGLLIGMIGPSGGGKTYSAMRLASGLSNGKPFAVIDTESRRALHYADMFKFDHAELHAPFRPDAYAEAIKAADAAGYPVVVVDSCSHEWAGEGGILDWQEEELTRMAGDDYRKREACKMAAWIRPKMSHKQMMQRLLQVKAHLILCFRAEEKTGMEKDANGKTVIVQKGWQPICEKNVPYELGMSFLLTPDHPGIGQPLKLQEQHRKLFDLNQPIDEKAGQRLAEWAAGGTKAPGHGGTHMREENNAPEGQISPDQSVYISDILSGHADLKAKIVKKYGSIAKIPLAQYQPALDWIRQQIGE